MFVLPLPFTMIGSTSTSYEVHVDRAGMSPAVYFIPFTKVHPLVPCSPLVTFG